MVSGNGKTLYVACADARQVAWVDLGSRRVTRRVGVPAEPTGLTLSPDGSKLFVTCAAPQSIVVVLDAVSGKLLATIPAGHTAMSPVVSPDGRRLYVVNRFDNDVSIIDLDDSGAGKEVARVAAVREPIAAALVKRKGDGGTLLVANHLPLARTNRPHTFEVTPLVTAVDTRTLRTEEIPLPHGANGVNGLCVLPDGEHALVTHLLSNFEELPFRVDMGWIDTNVVSIIDVGQRRVISTIGLDDNEVGAGNPYGVAFTAGAAWVCVSLAGTHELCFIGGSELLGERARRTMQPMMGAWPIYVSLGSTLWERVALPGIGPRGLAAAGSKVYAAQYFSDSVAEVDFGAADGPSVTSIALGPPRRLTAERRGEMFFHDATLCYQHWLSCASCHPDGRADALNWDLENDGTGNSKNTKSLLLAHRTPPAMAEGVRDSAESAVRLGFEHILFAERSEPVAADIDAYLKSLRPVPSPHLIDGSLSPAARRGRALFESERVGCRECHPPPLYTDMRLHNVGTGSPRERGKYFDTPTLIEVWRTAPYLHDGRYTTIRELFAEGQHGLGHGVELSQQENDDLAEFVLSL